MTKYAKVSIAIVLYNADDQVLLGKRIANYGSGEWHFPGGRLEFGEELEQAASRELLEETGIMISPKMFWSNGVVNIVDKTNDKHWVTVFMMAELENTPTPELLEPDKCEEWRWFDLSKLPLPLFPSTQHYFGRVG